MSKLLLSYYGDDFTGSTDVMEALASNGVQTVLFTRRPAEAEFRQFTDYLAIGQAGTSRSQSPEWMEQNLRPAFEWLKSLGAQFCHYKVCSTFDSAPEVGSIGRAIDIGRDVFAQETVPLVVGAPQLKRYTAFGHLFAAYRGQLYRIDRHPVMSRHPVTPMGEADLRLHLAEQTRTPVLLAGLDMLSGASVDDGVDAFVAGNKGIVLFDVIDDRTQRVVGRQLIRLSKTAGPFVAGSSGIEYALVQALRDEGSIPGETNFAPFARVDRLVAVSGSCSPTTERQIRYALAYGFDGVQADPAKFASESCGAEISRVIDQAELFLKAGRSVAVYTALGGGTDRGLELDAMPGARDRVGEALGRITGSLVQRADLKRIVIAGGDTSSHALGQLDIFAVTTRFPLKSAPGSPLCVAHSSNPVFEGLEFALKGGQIGGDDYFVMLRDGTC